MYLTVLKRSRIGTIGYGVMRVKIITADGKRPSMLRMATRMITILLFPEVIIFDLHGYDRTGSHQALSDRIAGTYLVMRSMPETVILSHRFTLDCFNAFTLASEE